MRIRNTLTFFTDYTEVENMDIRIHNTTLYNSILPARQRRPVRDLHGIVRPGLGKRPGLRTIHGRRLTMATRIEWLDDPNAPEVNSIIPAASVVVSNDQGEILLIQRSDNGNWTIPGGAMDHGESLTQTAIRECKEETGYDIEVTGLVGIYTNPNRIIEYVADDHEHNEVRQEFSVCYTGRAVGGESTANDEATRIDWVSPDKLDGLQMTDPIRQRIARYLSGDAEPYLG